MKAVSGVVRMLFTVLLVALATAGCGVFTEQPMRISAQFTDSVGLYEGNDVTVLGIKVGTVTRIQPQGTHVLVEMAIDPDTKIPADAGAVTLSPSVVTDRRVELTPAYRGGRTMRDGDLIPLDRTRTPVEIDRVFATVERLAERLSALEAEQPALSGAVSVAAETFRGNGDKLRQALHGLATAVGVGADHRDELVALIRDLERLTQAAADNDATLRSVSANLATATQLLDQQGPRLVRILDQVTELLDRAEALIAEHRGTATQTVDNLRVTARTLAERRRELTESVDVLPTTFRNLINIVDVPRKRARVHVGLDQALLDTQLLQGVCQRFGTPALCEATVGSPAPGSTLGLLFLGGAR